MARLFIGLLLFLSLATVPARAEWIKVDFARDGSFTVYADLDTKRRAGEITKVWVLFDFNTTQRDSASTVPFLSDKRQIECDCEAERQHMLAWINYSEHMGEGTVTAADMDVVMGFEPNIPGTIAESIWKVACDKK